MRPVKSDIVRGHLDGLILAALENGPLHGYAILEELHRASDGVLDLPAGTVYPALRRLERAKYVTGAWEVVGGRRRRRYRLARAGRQMPARERPDRERLTRASGSGPGGGPP